MTLVRPTSSQQRCKHDKQTYEGTNKYNFRSRCVNCGYNVVHIGTNYVKEETWLHLAQHFKLRAGASAPSPFEPATPSGPVPSAPSGLAPVLASRLEPGTAETERPREAEAEMAEQPRETETESFLRAARQEIERQHNRLNTLEFENRALKEKLEQAELLGMREIGINTLMANAEPNTWIEVARVMRDESTSSSKGPSSRR